MTTVIIIGLILLLLVLFVGWGIIGWILRGIGSVFELIFEGGEFGMWLSVTSHPLANHHLLYSWCRIGASISVSPKMNSNSELWY